MDIDSACKAYYFLDSTGNAYYIFDKTCRRFIILRELGNLVDYTIRKS